MYKPRLELVNGIVELKERRKKRKGREDVEIETVKDRGRMW